MLILSESSNSISPSKTFPFSLACSKVKSPPPDGSALFAFTKLAIDAPESSTIPFYQSGGKLLTAKASNANEAVNLSQLTTIFDYTPTGDFSMSQLKTAVENEGLVFNGITIYINNGSNNYTCNIDIGATNIGKEGIIQRKGVGQITFTSTRTLDAGVNNITILSGNQSSFCYFQFLDKDYIKIRLS